MKAKITCKKCDAEFVLTGRHIGSKDSIACPNCDNKISQEIFNLIKIGLSSLEQAHDALGSQYDHGRLAGEIEFQILDP